MTWEEPPADFRSARDELARLRNEVEVWHDNFKLARSDLADARKRADALALHSQKVEAQLLVLIVVLAISAVARLGVVAIDVLWGHRSWSAAVVGLVVPVSMTVLWVQIYRRTAAEGRALRDAED